MQTSVYVMVADRRVIDAGISIFPLSPSHFFSSDTIFLTFTHSVVVLTVCKFFFHAFVLKQKVEPKIQAHSMRVSHLCDKSFCEWAIGPLRNPTARAARLCLEHFHRTPVSRWSPMSTALNFSWGKV